MKEHLSTRKVMCNFNLVLLSKKEIFFPLSPLRLVNGAEYLFVARDDEEVSGWVEAVNAAIDTAIDTAEDSAFPKMVSKASRSSLEEATEGAKNSSPSSSKSIDTE